MTKSRAIPRFLIAYANMGTKAEENELRSHMGNWLRIHNYIKRQRHHWTIAQMMLLEYKREDGPRMDVVTRLYMRFSKLRYERERREL